MYSIEAKEHQWVWLIESVASTKIKIEVHESLKLKFTADYFAHLKIVKFKCIIFETSAIKVLHLPFVSISAKYQNSFWKVAPHPYADSVPLRSWSWRCCNAIKVAARATDRTIFLNITVKVIEYKINILRKDSWAVSLSICSDNHLHILGCRDRHGHIFQVGVRWTSRYFFFAKDMAPRWASNHGPFCGEYREK